MLLHPRGGTVPAARSRRQEAKGLCDPEGHPARCAQDLGPPKSSRQAEGQFIELRFGPRARVPSPQKLRLCRVLVAPDDSRL